MPPVRYTDDIGDCDYGTAHDANGADKYRSHCFCEVIDDPKQRFHKSVPNIVDVNELVIEERVKYNPRIGQLLANTIS